MVMIIVNFFKEYTPDGSQMPIKNVKQIAIRYFKGNFMFDFIMIFPFPFILVGYQYTNYFYLIKIWRFWRGAGVLNVT